MDSKQMQINTIVWASDLSKAEEIAKNFTNGVEQNNGFYSFSNSNYTLNSYVRSPFSFSTAAPSTISDIIIVYLSSADESTEAKKYLDSRKGIPIKILCSDSDLLEEAASLECKFVKTSEVVGEGKETILKEALKFEETLVNCFNKFDVNGNGLISIEELIKVSEELGHSLELDDAKMIASSLDETKSNSANINFNGFKKWWVMGKSDFHLFRRICKTEMSVNNLVKLTSKKFNSYLENLKNDSEKVSEQEMFQGADFNIHSKQSFDNGLGVFIEMCSGDDAKEAIDSYHEKVSKRLMSFSVKIAFSDVESANGVCEMLNTMILRMISEMPQLASVLSLGLELSFRVSENFVVMDASLTGLFADMFMNQMQQFNVKNLNLSGDLSLHIFTSLTLQHLINDSIFEMIEKAMHFKFHFNTKSFGLRALITNISEQIAGNMASSYPGMNQGELKMILMMTQIAAILHNFNVNLAFDAVDAKNLILDIVSMDRKNSDETFHQAKERFANGDQELESEMLKIRSFYSVYKEQAAAMKSMIPEEFLPVLKSVNLEKLQIEYILNATQGKAFVKATVNLPGLNAIRDELLA